MSAVNSSAPRSRIGGSFAQGTGLVTVVAPASNVNGILIRRAFCLGVSGGAYSALVAGTAAPTTWLTNPIICASFDGMTEAAEVFLPPGQGLYSYVSAAINWGLTYDLL